LVGEDRKDKRCTQHPHPTMADKVAGKKIEGDYHEPEFIQIVVSDPQRKGEFISYRITTSV
jgi:hypothetical protein